MVKELVHFYDWLVYHPYKKPSAEIDYEYLEVANKVFAMLQKHVDLYSIISRSAVKTMAVVLTSYLEDVVSHIGIWKTFNDECMKHYGFNVPFYKEADDYIKGDVNIEDIKFLIWLIIKNENITMFINPENEEISRIADDVYEILSDEYSYVPENEIYRQCLVGKFDDFYKYRDFLKWFHYNCYLNLDNFDIVSRGIDEMFDKGYNLSNKEKNGFKYNYEVDTFFNSRTHFFGYTSYDWLCAVRKLNGANDIWDNMHTEKGTYKVIDEDECFVYFENVESGEKRNLTKWSLIDKVPFAKGQYLTFAIVQCDGKWFLNGTMINTKFTEEDVKDKVINKKFKENSDVRYYEKFMEVNDNKQLIFFASADDYKDFLRNKMELKFNDDIIKLPFDGAFAMFVEKDGQYLFKELMNCIKAESNPAYNKTFANENAANFYISGEIHPYTLACYLKDNGLLPDARLVSAKGDDYGRKFLNDNLQFIIDFAHRNCR